MIRRLLTLALIGLVGCATPLAQGQESTTTLPSDKVFVCKYVGTPGVDEVLQTGQNPISVNVASLPQPVIIGQFFADEQGRSVAIAFDVGQPEPGPEDCPVVTNTTTTTTSTTTTTLATTTSTSSTTTSSSSTSSTSSSTTTPRDTTTTTAPPDLEVDFLTPICDGDVPYLSYSASFGDATSVDRITFVNPDGPDVSYFNLSLEGRVLWAGAVVAADGTPLDWPGWIQLPDETWVEGDDGFLWVRPSVTVELEINPVVSAEIGYPPATPLCDASPPDNPPPPNPPPVPPTLPPVTPPVTTIPGLPVTH
jgi:hypothetical protein